MIRLPGVGVPVLAVLGTGRRADGLGHQAPRTCCPTCRPAAASSVLEDAGHFVHIERPHEVAEMVLEFARVTAVRSATTRCPSRSTTCARGRGPPAAAPARPRRALARRGAGAPGSLARAGVGARPHRPRRVVDRSRRRRVLRRGADGRRRRRARPPRRRHVFGRGLGAYVALLIAGAPARAGAGRHPLRRPRPRRRRRAPGSPVCSPASSNGPPRRGQSDPCPIELRRDVRPPDYATTFRTRRRARSPGSTPRSRSAA